MNLNLKVGDVLLSGRFKNKRNVVKSLGTDELGQPVFNKDRKLLSVRIEKKLPEGMWSSKTLAEKYKDKPMNKQAYLEGTYNLAFEDELEKISGVGSILKKIIKPKPSKEAFIEAFQKNWKKSLLKADADAKRVGEIFDKLK